VFTPKAHAGASLFKPKAHAVVQLFKPKAVTRKHHETTRIRTIMHLHNDHAMYCMSPSEYVAHPFCLLLKYNVWGQLAFVSIDG
jgi:hypothetical protein